MSSVFSIIMFSRGYDESEYKEGCKYKECQGSHKLALSDFQITSMGINRKIFPNWRLADSSG